MDSIMAYHLGEPYDALISLVRQYAPAGVSERWGVIEFEGIPDFRLKEIWRLHPTTRKGNMVRLQQ